ncbi:hypothetical protein GUJ93_ZPchr0008g13624 [Zizania palustris]|uniref:Uncharacterized protein n=1 Tax=Zizania palustris TaxID=103762 RepID=A0A8J5VI08_ZIZPA|nr:hypothetical protein GUJ93_ZPchr0008g13624 [Zizania palustris]
MSPRPPRPFGSARSAWLRRRPPRPSPRLRCRLGPSADARTASEAPPPAPPSSAGALRRLHEPPAPAPLRLYLVSLAPSPAPAPLPTPLQLARALRRRPHRLRSPVACSALAPSPKRLTRTTVPEAPSLLLPTAARSSSLTDLASAGRVDAAGGCCGRGCSDDRSSQGWPREKEGQYEQYQKSDTLQHSTIFKKRVVPSSVDGQRCLEKEIESQEELQMQKS